MRINLPPKVRFAIYVFNGLGTILVSYLFTKHYIGDPEVAAWGAFNVFTSGMAALNVSSPDK